MVFFILRYLISIMLLIDKENTTTTFILNSSLFGVTTTGLNIELYSDFTKVESSFALPSNTSQWPQRYDKYVFLTSAFNMLKVGLYSFKIIDSAKVVYAVGMLKVIDVLQTEEQQVDGNYITMEQIGSDDDYIVL